MISSAGYWSAPESIVVMAAICERKAPIITAAQWDHFDEYGYVVLDREQALGTDCDAKLQAMKKRIDEIMLGDATLDYSKLMMYRKLFLVDFIVVLTFFLLPISPWNPLS